MNSDRATLLDTVADKKALLFPSQQYETPSGGVTTLAKL